MTRRLPGGLLSVARDAIRPPPARAALLDRAGGGCRARRSSPGPRPRLDLVQRIPAGGPVACLSLPSAMPPCALGGLGCLHCGWATLLWLPDLLLPRDRPRWQRPDRTGLGHRGSRVRWLPHRCVTAGARQSGPGQKRAAGSGGAVPAVVRHQHVPILVADSSGTILDAESATRALIPGNLPGSSVHDVLGADAGAPGAATRRVTAISVPEADLRDCRVSAADVQATPPKEPRTQGVLEDVTQERTEERACIVLLASAQSPGGTARADRAGTPTTSRSRCSSTWPDLWGGWEAA